MNPVSGGIEKGDPNNWVNRPLNGYSNEIGSLMVTACKNEVTSPPSGGFVTDVYCGVRLTLCRKIYVDGTYLAVPVGRDEAVLWNVPFKKIFIDAIQNTAVLFPPSVYDLRAGKYIELKKRNNFDFLYNFETDISEVAENPEVYENGMESGLRFIVSADGIVEDAIIFYPGLMRELSYKLSKNPTVLVCGPGKMFVFESGKRKKSIRNYIERYKDYIGDPSYEPYMFRYAKDNNALIDLNKDAEPKFNPYVEAKIPQGSVASAWGDISYRRDMIEWKRGKNQ